MTAIGWIGVLVLVIMLLIIVVINGMINYRDGLVLHARRSTMASVNTVTFQWMKLSDTTEFIVRSVAVDSRQFQTNHRGFVVIMTIHYLFDERKDTLDML